MRLYVIRHAHAGARGTFNDDIQRPLSPKGIQQANDLDELFRDVEITRVVSSPAVRCVETVAPLARSHGLEVDTHDDLWETAQPAHLMALLNQSNDPGLAICSHGNIIPPIVEQMARDGAQIRGRGCEKGSIWVVDRYEHQWTKATYIATGAKTLNWSDRLSH